MKLFQCTVCDQVLFFENAACTKCGHGLAYCPDFAVVSPLEPAEGAAEGFFVALAPQAHGAKVRLCSNYAAGICNWAIVATEEDAFCRSCRLSAVIPDLTEANLRDAWLRLERAKRRLLYTLLDLGLPVESKAQDPERGLSFRFMKDAGNGARVLTGHSDGVITLNVAEADDPFREKLREQLGEAYRTLLGHFRHEIGHYYWDRLVRETDRIDRFREMFGDESASYEDALKRHYEQGPPASWGDRFVSAYASMHPWEDFAETWAHYLHMVDTLETARAYGLAARPHLPEASEKLRLSTSGVDFDDFEDLMKAWVPLTLAVNSLNRSMGLRDPYPFVLSKAAIEKLEFVHQLIEEGAREPRTVGRDAGVNRPDDQKWSATLDRSPDSSKERSASR